MLRKREGMTGMVMLSEEEAWVSFYNSRRLYYLRGSYTDYEADGGLQYAELFSKSGVSSYRQIHSPLRGTKVSAKQDTVGIPHGALTEVLNSLNLGFFVCISNYSKPLRSCEE